ncbi:MAG: LptA/OstA family protein [Candidatus Omnitrophica bacterium]|nr:LptA/OstA family protein [Candidatus Omnitrophota bacterium]
MGKNSGKIITITLIIFMVMSGCGRKKSTEEVRETGQVLRNFTMQFFDTSFSITLTGLAAEKNSANTQASVSKPAIEIRSKNFIVEIKTGTRGTGEVFLDPETQDVIKIVIQNNVSIIQRIPETNQVNFSASCERLTYLEKEDTIIMDGSPIVTQGTSHYSADRITYSFKENKLKFDGNVKVLFNK